MPEPKCVDILPQDIETQLNQGSPIGPALRSLVRRKMKLDEPRTSVGSCGETDETDIWKDG
eukprot:3475087-Pyramimonas_sp.AAC.1